jgi:hypothetical protein
VSAEGNAAQNRYMQVVISLLIYVDMYILIFFMYIHIFSEFSLCTYLYCFVVILCYFYFCLC